MEGLIGQRNLSGINSMSSRLGNYNDDRKDIPLGQFGEFGVAEALGVSRRASHPTDNPEEYSETLYV